MDMIQVCAVVFVTSAVVGLVACCKIVVEVFNDIFSN